MRSVGTGEHYTIPAGLIVACIGYQTPPIPGVPYEHGRGRFANQDGMILPGLYCVGWARRGPSGTIGTNKPDGAGIAARIIADGGGVDTRPTGKRGRAGLDALIAARHLDIVTFRDWQKIDEVEVASAREGAPREKLVEITHMLDARGGTA